MARSSDWGDTIAAGLLAGAAATYAMDGYWRLIKNLRPMPARGEEPAPSRVAADFLRRAGFRRPSRQTRQTGGQVVHWGYGLGWGVLAALARRAGLKLDYGFGQPLGAALELGGDLYGVYWLGYARHPKEYPRSLIWQSFGGHAVYGAALWASLAGWRQLTQSHFGERLGLARAA